jgi:predicted Zn-dependent peptidase
MVYAATNPRSAKKVVQLITQELAALKKQYVSREEIQVAKDHLKGNLMLCLENTSSRMSNISRQEIYFHRQFSLSEMLKGIDSVSVEHIRDFSRKIFVEDHLALAVLGNLSGVPFPRKDLSFDGR